MFHHHDFSLSWVVNMQRKDQPTSIKYDSAVQLMLAKPQLMSSRMMYGKSLPTNYTVHFEVMVEVLRDPHISK